MTPPPAPDTRAKPRPDSPRYETLADLLDGYRTPIVIILFGLVVSLSLFFAALVSQSHAKERDFRNIAAARTSEIANGLRTLEDEAEEMVAAIRAGLPPQTIMDIFSDPEERENAPLLDLGLITANGTIHATVPEIGGELSGQLAALQADTGTRPNLLRLPTGDNGGVRFALILPANDGTGALSYAVTDFDRLIGRMPGQDDPAWFLVRFGDTPPAFALGRNLQQQLASSPAMLGEASLLETAPFTLRWTAPAPFDGLAVDVVPRRTYLLSVGVMPMLVLVFSLFATGTIGALALKDARQAELIRSEVRRKTAELKRSHDIIAAKNEELARFAAHASHDLQAPLRAMKGMSSLLVERKVALDDRSQQMLLRINRGAERAQQLVQDLLSYTRADTSRVSPEILSPDEIASEITELLGPAVEECGGQLAWSLDHPVEADRFLFSRALQNLVANAIKYRGTRPPRVTIASSAFEAGTLVCVSDNGIGIEPKYFQRIFEVFERLHGTDEYEGNGIGLALCKRVAELHGGRIWVESTPGEGSRFCLYIPSRTLSGQAGTATPEDR